MKKYLDPKQLKIFLEDKLGQLNPVFGPDFVERILHFILLLDKWNRAYNLTRITEPEKIITHHILDSLSVLPYISGKRVIDVGTGAGFPGIPLALASPEKQFVLLDSVGKKIRFLTQAVAELNLKNVELVQSRVEDYHPAPLFNTVIARALTGVNDMIAISDHLLAKDGRLIMMKGAYPSTELAELKLPYEVHRVEVPGLNEERHVVIVNHL